MPDSLYEKSETSRIDITSLIDLYKTSNLPQHPFLTTLTRGLRFNSDLYNSKSINLLVEAILGNFSFVFTRFNSTLIGFSIASVKHKKLDTTGFAKPFMHLKSYDTEVLMQEMQLILESYKSLKEAYIFLQRKFPKLKDKFQQIGFNPPEELIPKS